MTSAKTFFFIILALLLISGGLLISKVQLPDPKSKPSLSIGEIINKLKDSFEFAIDYTVLEPNPSPMSTSSAEPTISPQSTPKSTPKPTLRPTTRPQTQAPSQPKTCYRYTVPHLDGSSSTKCYTQSDYQTLQSLGSQYNSAKSDYSFNTSVAQMYYKDNVEFFKSSGDKAQAQANEAQNRMGELALQMYAIEARGW